jgi:hypothetical protein
VEVRIGVQNAARELVIESADPAEKVEKTVADALAKSSPTLVLVDEKGRRVIVATEKLAYVEISETDARRVGFGAI